MTGSIIARALASIFGQPDELRVLFLGLDASGRTTALYLMKLGEIVCTIPTIGFNVETIKHAGMSITAWDVGGCDKIRPLWRHYYQNTQAVLFFADSNDRDRHAEARHELHLLLQEEELRDAVVMVAATKQDLPNSRPSAEMREALGLDTLERQRDVAIACVGTTNTRESWEPVFDLLGKQVQAHRNRPGAKPVPQPVPGQGKTSGSATAGPGGEDIEKLLERWLEMEDEPDDQFLAALDDYTLDKWDHRTHLRIAWLLLNRHGRREGMTRIFASIKAFISNSPRTKRASGRGTTFHETMTYFWTHMVHYAIVATNNPKGDFKTFLLLNPQLANGGLFLHYYTKKLMLETAETRTQVALPDKRALPSILGDIDRLKTRLAAGPGPLLPPPKPTASGDDMFTQQFENQTLDYWGHQAMLRVICAYLLRLGRRKAVDKICDGLKALQKDGFNLTLTYFWLQMVTLALLPDHQSLLFPPANTAASPPASHSTHQPARGSAKESSITAADVADNQLRELSLTSASASSIASGDLDSLSTAPSEQLARPGTYDAVAPAEPALAGPALPSKQASNSNASSSSPAITAQPISQSTCVPDFEALLSGNGKVSKSLRKLLSEPQLYLKHYTKDLIYSDSAAQQVALPDKKPLPSQL